MKIFRTAPRNRRQGFSLVESTLSLGILSFGFLSLAPLLGLGLDSARQARDRQLAAQIAETLVEQAREGALAAGESSYDDQGAACTGDAIRFRVTTTETALPGNCTRVTLEVTPADSPRHPFAYGVVLPNP